ncbi:MAG: peptidylprolyl isomerase [Candidatus Aenigmarchaeota archaeon]|nr:peptidylprolyl isomerase [Candidatus Aenigmarchaeota archaeon]
MKDGDFIYIDYIGRVKGTGEVFDLTIEETAKKENIYNSSVKYKPVPIVVGGNFVLKGLDEALLGMNVGDKKTVEIPVEKAFGERRPEFLRLIPMSVFKEQNIDPNPGSYVTINNLNGRVVSSDGGRIRVDFNHPLAGKKLEYEVEIKGEIKEDSEKVMAIVSYYTNLDKEDVEVKVAEKTAEINIKNGKEMPSKAKETIFNTITKWIGIEKIRFVYEYGK